MSAFRAVPKPGLRGIFPEIWLDRRTQHEANNRKLIRLDYKQPIGAKRYHVHFAEPVIFVSSTPDSRGAIAEDIVIV